MKLINADIWDANLDLTIVTTNGVLSNKYLELIMGAGIARQAAKLYPDLPSLAFKHITSGLYNTIYDKGIKTWLYGYFDIEIAIGRKFIGFFQTKLDYDGKSNLALIGYSVMKLNLAIAKMSTNITIGMVYPGIGLGGLDISQVQPVLANLDERVKVFIQN